MKPRLLWPSKEDNDGGIDPEEASTDIEINEPIPEATPRKKRNTHSAQNGLLDENPLTASFPGASSSAAALATPPPSTLKRRKVRNIEVSSKPDIFEDDLASA